jgi:hypothetical protein
LPVSNIVEGWAMARWSNPPLTLYHGTHSNAVGATLGSPAGMPLPAFVPDLARCRGKTDFGLGFYTATNPAQAREWANKRVQRSSSATVAVVVAFDVSREALAGFASLVFVTDSADFWDLVEHCRNGGTPLHGRSIASGAYDVVYGPVSLSWQRRLVIRGSDQVSLHTSSAVGALPAAYLADTAWGRTGLF